MAYLKETANEFIEKNKNRGREDFQPVYHFAPPVGWINDPNGLIYYRGYYHLFYQFYPYDIVWGPMHWGHSRSKDMITFEHLPVALAPDCERENGCYSGGAVISADDENQLVALYTRHYEENGNIFETQCKTVSTDGVNFRKCGEVIGEKDLPPFSDIRNFRDPNPVYIEGRYYVVVGNQSNDGRGRILVYVSDDLKKFTHFSTIEHSSFGAMVECPDLFRMDGKDVLVYSVYGMQGDDWPNHDGKACLYAVGRFNTVSGRFDFENVGSLDEGTDFYAAQTLEDEQKRRVLLGWLGSWDGNDYLREIGHRTCGKYSLPRVLSIVDGRLVQTPVENVFSYVGGEFDVEEGVKIQKNFFLKTKMSDGARFSFGNGGDFIEVYAENGRIYCKTRQKHRVSCTRSIGKTGSGHDVLVFSDKGTAEIFADGETVSFQAIIEGDEYTVLAAAGLENARAGTIGGNKK